MDDNDFFVVPAVVCEGLYLQYTLQLFSQLQRFFQQLFM